MEPFKQSVRSNEQHLFFLQRWMDQFPGLTAGFTSRQGGVSTAPYASFNMGLHVGDQYEAVLANRRQLASSIGWSFETWISAEQIHTNKVAVVTAEHRGLGSAAIEDAIAGVDALVTNELNILLTSFYADCVPLLFYDPIQDVMALAHAGWKGTVTEIAKWTIQTMEDQFSCQPQQIRAAIGPAISACCYEVDQPVIDRIMTLWKEKELPLEQLSNAVQKSSVKNAYIDLKDINRQLMIKAGILPTHIELSNWCTGCHPELFFSHRKENGQTGRMASWIGRARKVL